MSCVCSYLANQSGRQIYSRCSFPEQPRELFQVPICSFINLGSLFNIKVLVPILCQFLVNEIAKCQWYSKDCKTCLVLALLSITITAEKPLLNYMKLHTDEGHLESVELPPQTT